MFYSYYKVNSTLNKFSHCMLLFIVSETCVNSVRLLGQELQCEGSSRAFQPKTGKRRRPGHWGGVLWKHEEKRIHLTLWHRQKFSIELLTSLNLLFSNDSLIYLFGEQYSHRSVSSDGYREDLFWGVYSSLTEGDQKHQPEKCLNASAVSTTIEERPLQNKASTRSPHYDLTKFTG